ncbi:MAG: DUF6273 domain-containing protein, partial [Oscillospiraceae bacterium]|nr:DUF6273 domain-containing protein [Oscillospiraceae bacterium]
MKTKKSFLPLRLAAATVLTLLFVFSLATNATDPYTLTYTLTCSESNTTLGDGTVSAMETSDTTMSINLTSPVGAATERYFTTSDTSEKTASVGGAFSDSNLVTVTANQIYKITIPEGFTGIGTFTVGDYVITFTVTDSIVGSNVVKPGETFKADGIEWRVLMQDGSNSLVIAEHVIETRAFHNTTVYPTWDISTIKAYLNGTFLTGLTTLSSKAIEKSDIMTMSKAYQNTEGGTGTYQATTDKIFLLSIEEVYYTGTDGALVQNGATVSTAVNRTNGDTVIFADAHARKSTVLSSLTESYWWLRSPNDGIYMSVAFMMQGASGDYAFGDLGVAHGIRPALWLNLESPLSTSFLLTVNGGSGGGYYAQNIVVSIAANTTPGQTYTNWTKSGDDGIFASDTEPFTTFTMPASEST